MATVRATMTSAFPPSISYSMRSTHPRGTSPDRARSTGARSASSSMASAVGPSKPADQAA